MPNARNIDAPIAMVSPGRSGTTLMSSIFGNRSDCASSGETLDLIFGLWNAALMSLPHISPEKYPGPSLTANEMAGDFVRRGMLILLSDDKKHWFQKPIGLPSGFNAFLFDETTWDGRAEEYWHVMREVFPRGRFFTLLRHPCDIVLSFRRKFGVEESKSWASLGMLAHIILHRDSLVRYAVDFEQITARPEAALAQLLDYCGLAFDRRMLDAFASVHTHVDPGVSSQSSNFSWKERWSELDPRCAEARFVEPIRRLYERFGMTLEMPFGDFAASPTAVAGDAPDADEGLALRRRIAQLEIHIQQLETVDHEIFLRGETEAHAVYRGIETQLTELTALRRNPFVRVLSKTGLLGLTDRFARFLP
jgi:hypothetical protein